MVNIDDFLCRALLHGSPGLLQLHAQPLVSTRGLPPRVELLSRFEDAGQSLPLPLVQSRIATLGLQCAWDLQVCEQAVALATAGRIPAGNLNISSGSLLNPQVRGLLSVLARQGCWTLELLEDDAMLCLPAMQAPLQELVHEGLRLTVDDFGTGQSARILATLRPLVSGVKVARELLVLGTDDQYSVVAGVVRGLKAAGLTVTVEGIETAADEDLARTTGADWLQGYFIGRPQAC